MNKTQILYEIIKIENEGSRGMVYENEEKKKVMKPVSMNKKKVPVKLKKTMKSSKKTNS